jgi:hypothetical protein
LILQFVTARIIVVPINVQSDPIELHNENEDKDEDAANDDANDEKIDHWDIWEEMIRISINNPLNWYSFNLNI